MHPMPPPVMPLHPFKLILSSGSLLPWFWCWYPHQYRMKKLHLHAHSGDYLLIMTILIFYQFVSVLRIDKPTRKSNNHYINLIEACCLTHNLKIYNLSCNLSEFHVIHFRSKLFARGPVGASAHFNIDSFCVNE